MRININRITFISLLGLLAVMIVAGFAPNVFAKDVLLDATIDSAVVATDKNGNEYARLIIKEPRTLQGVSYVVTVPVMCFGQTVAAAKQFKSGDSFKAIAQTNEYQGRKNYNIVTFVE